MKGWRTYPIEDYRSVGNAFLESGGGIYYADIGA